MVEVSTRALLAPPGIGIFTIGALSELEQGAELHGSSPELLPSTKMSGATGTSETEDLEPPHSGPQFRM